MGSKGYEETSPNVQSKSNSHVQGRGRTIEKRKRRKKSGEKGIFSLQEREIRAEKTGAGRAGRCTDQLMNITELTHPVAWNA